MSSTGNRRNPNQTRIAGHPAEPPQAAPPAPAGRTHQESRDHNKHNRSGEDPSHKPQRHNPAEEKH
jgi:hypothetical protein